MSVNMMTYVVAGIKFSDSSDLGDSTKYEDMMEDNHDSSFDKKRISMIWDGFYGDYVLVGRVLAKGMEEDGLEMTKVSLMSSKMSEIMIQIAMKHPDIYKKFEKLKDMDPPRARHGVWAFSHWH